MAKRKSKYHFDKDLADRAISFVETQCVHMKGEFAGMPLLLEDWQKEIVGNIFGMVDSKGFRQYRQVFIFVPRKNAKTTLVASLSHLLLYVDQEPGAEIYCAAGDKDQARLVFNVAKHMVTENPEMAKRSTVLRDTITLNDDPSFMRVISAEAHTKHGFNAHGILFDELHTQPNRELYDVLTTSVGSRRQPLTISMTTAGHDKQSICYKVYDYACKVRDGVVKDDRFYPVIYEAGIKDDPFKKETWEKANPGLGSIIKLDYIRDQSKRARTEPSFYNTFLQLHLNIWTNAESAWIIAEDFQKCNLALLDPGALEGRECYGGLDLASTDDTSAFVLEFPNEETGISDVLCWVWIPQMRAEERTKREQVDYLTFIRNGQMISISGNTQDYNFIKKTIMDCCETYDVKCINVDRWNSSQLIIDLIGEGISMNRFNQGFPSMSTPTKDLERTIMAQEVNHGGNPVLAWQMSNVILARDDNDNVKPSKKKSKDKIDLIYAWIMARAAYMQKDVDGDGHQIYNDRGIISI